MANKHPGGRPSKYNKDLHPLLGEALASKGLINPQIAEKMGVSTSTLGKWMKEHEEFSDAIKRGREEPDDLVENSLFRRATGYENDKAVKIFMPANAKEPVYAPYTEQVQPDVTACIFWLKNRRPDRWRDKQDINLSGGVDIKRDFSKLTDAQLEELEKLTKKIDVIDPDS